MQDEQTLDMSKAYIYEGLEYILTGRTAEKTIETPSRPTRRSRRKNVVDIYEADDETVIMVEIKPSPKKDPNRSGPIPTGDTKWVMYSELFMIVDMLDEDEEHTAPCDY